MPGLSPQQSAQLQALIDANRAPATGTWASPNTAPLAAPAAAAPISAPVADPALAAPVAPASLPVAPADAPVTAPIVAASPGDAATVVAPVSVPAPPVAETPSVSQPAASTAGLEPSAPVEAAPLPAAPRNFEEAQARSAQATQNYAQATREEGDARARSEAANAQALDAQAVEMARDEQDFKREQAEAQADRDEVKAQVAFAQEQNSRLNKITDRRTTTQKVLGVIAQALGSVADGFSRMGGNTNTNFAGQISDQLEKQIQADMQRQQEAIEGRNKDVAVKLTELGQAEATLKDKQSAHVFVTSRKQARFAVELKAQAARSNSDMARQEMLTAAAKLEADAARNDAILQERLTEQKYRSRQLGKSGAGGGGALDLAAIRQIVENNGTLTPAQLKAAQSMGLFKDHESKDVNLADLQGKVDRKETLSPQEARVAASAGMLKSNEDKADTADQAKARMLFTSSARPAAALEARMRDNKLVGNEASWAEKLGLAPDEWNKQAALQAQEIESVGNDILRYESGASISTQETEGLIARSRSSDPDVARAAVQRLLDKRAALGQAFKQRPQSAVSPATGGETRAKAPPAATPVPEAPPGKTWVVDGNGRRGTIPNDRLEAALNSGQYFRLVN